MPKTATATNGNRLTATDELPSQGISVTIKAPALAILKVLIQGTSPYCQHRFGQKAMLQMKAKQEAGSTSAKGKKREPKNFDSLYEESKHKTKDDWCGIPAGAFRSAMISACRLVGFKMTHAKLAVFVEADGVDVVDHTPLVRISKGEPSKIESPMKNDNGGVDIRVRAIWDAGWQAIVRVKFDTDIFTAEDVMNLLARVGEQVGIGEGRHDSKECSGCGWGTFEIKGLVE